LADKGIDGFRMDAFSILFQKLNFPELPKEIVNKPVEIIKLWQWPSTT
jgi:oligo-1,6-glucosidase